VRVFQLAFIVYAVCDTLGSSRRVAFHSRLGITISALPRMLTEQIENRFGPSLVPLGTFVVPFEDETVHSLLARYFTLYCGRYRASLLQRFFGPKCVTINYGMGDYARFVAACPTGLWSDVSEFVERHTLVPFFEPFGLTQSRGRYISSSFEERFRKAMHAYAVASPRFCAHCVRQDASELGMPYWHRAHQIRGVTVCHIHGAGLVISCPRCGSSPARELDLSLPPLRCKCGFDFLDLDTPERSDSDSRSTIALARFAHGLLKTRLPKLEPSTWGELFRHSILDGKQGRTGEPLFDLWQQLMRSYPGAALREMKVANSGESIPNWLRKLCASCEAGGSAPRKVAVLNLLYSDFKEFEGAFRSYLPEGDANCRNHSSELLDFEFVPTAKPRETGPRASAATVSDESIKNVEKDRAKDEQMVERLRNVIARFLRQSGRPVKMTANRMRVAARIPHERLDRFPQTSALLNEAKETSTAFVRRKAKWAYDELLQSGCRITLRSLLAKSGTASSPFGRLHCKSLLEESGI